MTDKEEIGRNTTKLMSNANHRDHLGPAHVESVYYKTRTLKGVPSDSSSFIMQSRLVVLVFAVLVAVAVASPRFSRQAFGGPPRVQETIIRETVEGGGGPGGFGGRGGPGGGFGGGPGGFEGGRGGEFGGGPGGPGGFSRGGGPGEFGRRPGFGGRGGFGGPGGQRETIIEEVIEG